MKVRELQSRLAKLDPDIDVLCWTEDSKLVAPKHGFRLFDIEDVSPVDGEKTRGDDQVPSLKLTKSSKSQRLAIIEITSDF